MQVKAQQRCGSSKLVSQGNSLFFLSRYKKQTLHMRVWE